MACLWRVWQPFRKKCKQDLPKADGCSGELELSTISRGRMGIEKGDERGAGGEGIEFFGEGYEVVFLPCFCCVCFKARRGFREELERSE